MAIWDLSGHALLDPPDLAGAELAEQTGLAEFVLGLRPYSAGDFDATESADLQRALALQVSLQSAASPEAYLAESVGRSGESVSYREGVILHPAAAAIVDAIINAPPSTPGTAGEYAVLKSLR